MRNQHLLGSSDPDNTDPRRTRRASNRDRHAATATIAVPAIASLLANMGFHLRNLRERLIGR